MAQSNGSGIKVNAAIAKALYDNGVDTMFGVCGDANVFIVDSFIREFKGRYIAASNEAGATLMALGYASVSGKVGVATVTHGPGLANTLTSLIEGAKGQLPMVLICGDTAAEDNTHLQNIPQRDLIMPTGAGFEQLRSPRTAVQDVATALRRAIVERRPIVLNFPTDFQWQDIEYKPVLFKIPESRAFVPSSADMDDAVGIIAAAKRPIVLAGRGARSPEARAALLRLAERTDALLATTLLAKDLFKGEEFNLGISGTLSSPAAVDAIMEADCIISFGASLTKYTISNGTFLTGKRIVQCNLEPAEIGKYTRPDAGLVGDPALMADEIVRLLDEAEIPPSGFRSEDIRQKLKKDGPFGEIKDQSTATTLDIRTALTRLNAGFPADRLLVVDGGRFMTVAFKGLSVPEPRSFVFTSYFGSIGLGMAYAIGASCAAPGKPVLLVMGDGGFMLGGLTEFNTAIRHKIDIVGVVCNDGSYGAEHVQLRDRQMDPGTVMFDWPEFAPVAKSLGGEGMTVRTSDDLDRALAAIAGRKGPMLIDIKLDPDRMPERTH